MSRSIHPVRRCAKCDRDWPNRDTYNLCPRCQRNTYASTSTERPDNVAAVQEIAKYRTIREFDAKADAAADMARADWDADMELLLSRTADLPDPEGCDLPPLPIKPTNYGLGGGPAHA